MTAYYNEFNPASAAWLNWLIDRGHIVYGVVDTRSIEDVHPSDLRGFTQCHFFAGIGVWSYALRRAGWPDDRPVWTGSCPCQPFSSAGKGGGFSDERHLWPAWHYLIEQSRPPKVFGEQVASADGRMWLDLVSTDMEGIGYAFGAAVTTAAGYGAPEIRRRTYFVGMDDALDSRLERQPDQRPTGAFGEMDGAGELGFESGARGAAFLRRMAQSDKQRRERRQRLSQGNDFRRGQDGGWVEGECRLVGAEQMAFGSMADSDQSRLERRGGTEYSWVGQDGSSYALRPADFWADPEYVFGRDGSVRPVEPGTFPLANGVAARMELLHGYGNALVSAQAEGFIRCFLESEAAGFGVYVHPNDRDL